MTEHEGNTQRIPSPLRRTPSRAEAINTHRRSNTDITPIRTYSPVASFLGCLWITSNFVGNSALAVLECEHLWRKPSL
jgi:hypothetical protein